MQSAETLDIKTLKPGDFTISTGQMRMVPFRQIVPAVAQAGFSGLVIGMDVYTRAREAGLSAADIVALVADHGLIIEYLDGLVHWIESAPVQTPQAGGVKIVSDPRHFFEAASALGAPMINAVEVFGFNPGVPAMIDSLAKLAERASGYNLRICLEFTPLGAVPGLAEAMAIADGTGRDNAGVLFDCWHFKRSGGQLADLAAAPPARIFGVQLSDTAFEPQQDMFKETLHHRRLPGEGSANLPEVLQCLVDCGIRHPWSAEVYSDELLAEPLPTMLSKTIEAMRCVVPRLPAQSDLAG